MASNLDFFVAFLLGILPGIGILWVSLRRFDRPLVDHTLFDDRRVFGGLAAGLVFGTMGSVLTLSLSGSLMPRSSSPSSSASTSRFPRSRRRLRRGSRSSSTTTFTIGFCRGPCPRTSAASCAGIAGGPSRLGAEAHRSIEAARRLQYEVRSDEGRKRFLRMRNPKASEHALQIRHREDLEFPRELDGGRPDSVGAALGLGGDPDDPQVDVPRPDPSHGGRRLSIGLEASRDLRADLADERREFAGGVRPGADARRDHADFEAAKAGGRLLFQVNALRSFAPRADDHAVHGHARNTRAARQAP